MSESRLLYPWYGTNNITLVRCTTMVMHWETIVAQIYEAYPSCPYWNASIYTLKVCASTGWKGYNFTTIEMAKEATDKELKNQGWVLLYDKHLVML